MGLVWSDLNRSSRGGTELLMEGLEARLAPELMREVQIFPSRLTGPLDPEKIRILWCHDLPGDPMYDHLRDGGWRRFHKLVFVSHHQMNAFIAAYGIPWSRCSVLHNAIEPLPWAEKPDGPIRLVYTSTPHRGLNVLVAAFSALAEKRDDVVLDVFSSFGIYGWTERDEPFRPLFDACRAHPKIEYHGAVPNDRVREALLRSHVFAYPSTWPETSCLCLIEAMSADLVCVHSNYGALYETAGNWTVMYPYHERPETHAGIFLKALEVGVETAKRRRKEPSSQKHFADIAYDWNTRAKQWEALISSMIDLPREIEKGDSEFVYRVG